jgi:hypothetical protein
MKFWGNFKKSNREHENNPGLLLRPSFFEAKPEKADRKDKARESEAGALTTELTTPGYKVF